MNFLLTMLVGLAFFVAAAAVLCLVCWGYYILVELILRLFVKDRHSREDAAIFVALVAPIIFFISYGCGLAVLDFWGKVHGN